MLQGKEPSQVCDGYSETLLALEVVDCTAALPVTQPVFQFPLQTCKEVKNLCWSDFFVDYPGSSELLWCHTRKHRDGGAGIRNAVILLASPPLSILLSDVSVLQVINGRFFFRFSILMIPLNDLRGLFKS